MLMKTKEFRIRGKYIDFVTKKLGGWIAACPFCDGGELVVNQNETHYRCFVCGIGGRIFKWVRNGARGGG